MINKASKSLTRKTPSLAFALHCTKSRDRLSFLWNWIDAQCAYIFLLCLSIQVDLSREEASNLRILGRPDRFEIIDLPGCEIQNLVREALFPFVAASYSLVSVADLWRALNLAWFVATKKQRYKGTVRIQARSQVRCAVRERPRTLSRTTAANLHSVLVRNSLVFIDIENSGRPEKNLPPPPGCVLLLCENVSLYS